LSVSCTHKTYYIGALLAIEDALQLASCLRRALMEPSSSYSVANALEEYESLRRWRVHTVQFVSYLVGIVGPMSGPLRAIRDRILLFIPNTISV
jgi:2-polyprenyl-6-methoxyphenol hydroxylase-like FAD-dependent oxidoreductase